MAKSKLIEKFNRAFKRNDFYDFTTIKGNPNNIFDIVVGGKDGMEVHLTNDPEKMLLCGATIPSSYSPTSASFKYLPSLVLQDYMGMLYIQETHNEAKQYQYGIFNGERFDAPTYLARAFVMLRGNYIVGDMPIYSQPTIAGNKAYEAIDNLLEQTFYLTGWYEPFPTFEAETKAPEIHLDTLRLYNRPDKVKEGERYTKWHFAVNLNGAAKYPCRETMDCNISYKKGK